MTWVLVFGGIAIAGLVMLVCYGVWLAHKASDVMSELGMLGQRGAELGELVAQIQVPASADPGGGRDGDDVHSVLTGDYDPGHRSST